jgi:hypothetical protein
MKFLSAERVSSFEIHARFSSVIKENILLSFLGRTEVRS